MAFVSWQSGRNQYTTTLGHSTAVQASPLHARSCHKVSANDWPFCRVAAHHPLFFPTIVLIHLTGGRIKLAVRNQYIWNLFQSCNSSVPWNCLQPRYTGIRICSCTGQEGNGGNSTLYRHFRAFASFFHYILGFLFLWVIATTILFKYVCACIAGDSWAWGRELCLLGW